MEQRHNLLMITTLQSTSKKQIHNYLSTEGVIVFCLRPTVLKKVVDQLSSRNDPLKDHYRRLIRMLLFEQLFSR
jgi:hypothetical protein